MQWLTSCWNLVDWQKDSLHLASMVSFILLELCELDVFLLSWPGPSQSSSSGNYPGKYSSGRSRSCPSYCIGRHFLRIGYDVNKLKVVFVFWKSLNPMKMILDSAMASKMKNINPKKNFIFLTQRWFSSKKKLHGLSEEPNPSKYKSLSMLWQLEKLQCNYIL